MDWMLRLGAVVRELGFEVSHIWRDKTAPDMGTQHLWGNQLLDSHLYGRKKPQRWGTGSSRSAEPAEGRVRM
jgi:hypothetical protein